MQLLDLTLNRAVNNISLDEALLEAAEANDGAELLRLWEPNCPIVVLGRSSPIKQEVNLEVCKEQGIEVFRRCSGGSSIATGPNCLMYAVLLDYRKRPQLKILEKAHQFVMEQMAAAIQAIGIQVEVQGTCDLTLHANKFSGNAMRCKRNWMLYHGTMLCESFDLDLISKCLGRPSRQPEYRNERNHHDFLTLLPLDLQTLRQAIVKQWDTTELATDWPVDLTEKLSVEKYLTDAWTCKV